MVKMEQRPDNMLDAAERKEMDWRRKEGAEQGEGVCVGLVQ